MLAAGSLMKLTWDGYNIARLGTGERLTITTDPGEHAIGGTTTSSVTLNFESDEKYYFRVSYPGDGFAFERITPEKARDDGHQQHQDITP